MSALARERSRPESGVGRRTSGGAFVLALRHLAASSGARVAIAFALEGEELVAHAAIGAVAPSRIGVDDRRALARALASRRVERAPELALLLPRRAEALLVPLFDEDDPVGVVCLAFDSGAPPSLGCDAAIELAGMALATDLRRAHAQASDEDLRELSRLASVGVLLVGVVHELRGPAGALALLVPEIVAALEGADDKTADERRALGRDLRGSAERVLDLCAELRGAGRRDHQRVVVDLREVARDAVRLARFNAPQIAFAIVEEGAPVEVIGVRAELDQVALNLLLNAVDACRAAPPGQHRIDVSVLAEGSATLTVSDTGTGVDGAIADRVFERFFTTKPRGAGTGVGLWVSREIAEAHGGELALVPSREGATFAVRLPARARQRRAPTLVAETRPVDPEQRRDQSTDATRLRVLLVDDEPLVLRTHRRGLAAFDVRIAGSVADAIRELARGDVDVVVSDLGMPDGGGVVLHRWMLEHLGEARPPVLFLTGGVTHEQQRAEVDASGCRCLTKPVPMDALRAAIRHAAQSSRA